MVRKGGLEPPPLAGPDPKSGASANSATFAQLLTILTFNELSWQDRSSLWSLTFGVPISVPKPFEESLFATCAIYSNRLELAATVVKDEERYKKISLEMESVDRLLVEIFLEAYTKPPEEIVLDLDATDDPLHGQ